MPSVPGAGGSQDNGALVPWPLGLWASVSGYQLPAHSPHCPPLPATRDLLQGGGQTKPLEGVLLQLPPTPGCRRNESQVSMLFFCSFSKLRLSSLSLGALQGPSQVGQQATGDGLP